MIKPLNECLREAEDALTKLVDEAGTITHLSKMLSETNVGVFSPQTIGGWIVRGRISKRGAIAVIMHPSFKHFTCRQLRPDVEAATWVELIDEVQKELKA